MSKLGEIEGHIAAGKVIVAIKELRSVSGWGLRETKEAVDAYRASGQWPASVLALPGIAPDGSDDDRGGGAAAAFDDVRIPEQARGEIAAFCKKGKKIQAIKAMRDATGLGLRDAKDAVEHFMKHGDWQHPALSRSLFNPEPGPSSDPAEPAETSAGSAAASSDPPQPAAEPTSSEPVGSPSVAKSDPGLDAAVAALESELGHSVEVRLGFAAEHSFRSGYLVFIADRACFVHDDYGRWRVDPVLMYTEVSETEENSGLLGTELHVAVGYIRHRFAKLADGHAEAAVALFRVFAA